MAKYSFQGRTEAGVTEWQNTASVDGTEWLNTLSVDGTCAGITEWLLLPWMDLNGKIHLP